MTRLSQRWTVWSLSLLLAGAVLLPMASDQAQAQVAAPAQAAPANPMDLSSLASAARFEQVLATLKAAPATDARTASFQADVERYQQHQATWNAARQKAYDKALSKMVERTKAGLVDPALASAIEAHSLATEPRAMLTDERTVTLIKLAEKTAKETEAKGDWIETLTIFRSLDLLYDDFATYREAVRRAERHARLLRLYAPLEFKRLFDERIKRMAVVKEEIDKDKENENNNKSPDNEKPPEAKKENDDAIEPDQEKWQTRLKGVELPMLQLSLRKAMREHVSNPGYGPLLRGAIDAALVLSESEPLAVTFPGLGQPENVAKFRDGLLAIRRDVEVQEKVGLSELEAMASLDRIRSLSAKTIQLPDQVLTYELTDGALSVLDDFTAVIWPAEMESFSRNTQGEFFGVGIQISRRDGQLICVSPLEDTPAQKAGIKAGDVIAQVDQKDTSSWTLDHAVRQITGPLGTPVTLTIQRPGVAGFLEFKLTRAKIAIESIKGFSRKPGGGWDYFIDPVEHIGYVRLLQFIPQSAADLDAAINQMEQAGGVRALILDLRFNPGGLLQSAVEISNRFVKEGLLVDTVDKDGRVSEPRRARAHNAYNLPIPVVVLVNQGSASASEIVSGVLQDYSRALVVGTRSFGKGSVQDLMKLDMGEKAYLKLTTHYYRLPKGRIIHRKPDAKIWGIEPDLKVEMTDQQVVDALEFRQKADILRSKEELADPNNAVPVAGQIIEKGMDPQLEAALLALKTKLISPSLGNVQKAEAKPVR
jgi:carboxyl-terminal processing protease